MAEICIYGDMCYLTGVHKTMLLLFKSQLTCIAYQCTVQDILLMPFHYSKDSCKKAKPVPIFLITNHNRMTV